eukprot:gene21331-25618_t
MEKDLNVRLNNSSTIDKDKFYDDSSLYLYTGKSYPKNEPMSSIPPTFNNTPTIGGVSRSPFQKGKPPASPTIVSCVSDGVTTGVNISMSPSPVMPQPRKKSIISLFSL